MGQYYLAIILGPAPSSADGGQQTEFIRVWVTPHSYGCGAKLMEHSYIGNGFMNAIEYLLSPRGPHWKSRLVWAGDYADPEGSVEKNLYSIAYRDGDEEGEEGAEEKQATPPADATPYNYIVNHTKRLVVNRDEAPTDPHGFRIHPLALLTAEGNGRGGGDYHGTSETLVGSWARDVISVEKTIPTGYTGIEAKFCE